MEAWRLVGGPPPMGAAAPPSEEVGSHSLLLGPAHSGKTSLLYQVALSYARQGRKVVLVCPSEDKLRRNLPWAVRGQPKPPAAVTNAIRIRYLRDARGLLDYCCAVHLEPAGVAAILIDDFDVYLKSTEGSDTARVVALAWEAATFLGSLSDTGACTLLCACQQRPGSRSDPLYVTIAKRWLRDSILLQADERAGYRVALQCQAAPSAKPRVLYHVAHNRTQLVVSRISPKQQEPAPCSTPPANPTIISDDADDDGELKDSEMARLGEALEDEAREDEAWAVAAAAAAASDPTAVW